MLPTLVVLYLLFWFYNYLTVLVLYQLYWPRTDKDFIIVLGAGLMNGDQVTPLLAQRIDRGITFWKKQLEKNQKKAVVILSGGQGVDEKIPEGQAMKKYAISHGIPEKFSVAEIKSKNTFENMKFSKQIIDSFELQDPKTVFVSNNYHIFRAARYARQAGLKAEGIGSQTSKFFLPNAVIREYLALLSNQRNWHIFGMVVMALLAIVLSNLQVHPYFVGRIIGAIRDAFFK